MRQTFLNDRVTLHCGDARDILASLPENSIDSVVCDPPYGLSFMGRAWDSPDGAAFAPEFWKLALRVLKPGGHLVAFSGTRTYHRMACAIEDAGFECRDMLSWLYGSGFPKSHDVSKGIDKAAGAEREVVGQKIYADGTAGSWRKTSSDKFAQDAWTQDNSDRPKLETAPSTDSAKQWQGWGSALKPAHEPICLARKPLIGTIAQNVLEHGTGALNIDGCRVETNGEDRSARYNGAAPGGVGKTMFTGLKMDEAWNAPLGRWPANVLLDSSEEVLAAFPETSGDTAHVKGGGNPNPMDLGNGRADAGMVRGFNNPGGSAARFFYTAKADAEDRLGSKHPTVKPLDLMQWLVRLVCPKGGTVLDPFAGTGTTGEAAWREGMNAVLIEREPEYQADIARRMDLATKPTKRSAVAKTKNKLEDPNSLPLFAEV